MPNLFQKMIEFSKKNPNASVKDVLRITLVSHFKEVTLNKLEQIPLLKVFGISNSHASSVGAKFVDSLSAEHVDSIFDTVKKSTPFVKILDENPKIKNVVKIIDANILSMVHQVHGNEKELTPAANATTNATTNADAINEVIHL